MAAQIDQLPLISIVVPSFNQGHYLRETLESIFRQDYPRLEVIVMDGGSTDESVAIIRAYEHRLKYWQSQPDEGQSAAINAGMHHCTGELVAWLNSDDFYWWDSLWTVGRAYTAFPKRGLYIGNGLRYDQREKRYTPFCLRHLALSRMMLTYGTDFVLQPATFFLRSAWEKVEGLDPTLRFVMDWDILIRIAKHYPAVVINEFLAVSREYEQTKTRSGKMTRAFEIVRMIRSHSQQEMAPSSTLFLLDTLANVTESQLRPLRPYIVGGFHALAGDIAVKYSDGSCWPGRGDPQDSVYLPFAEHTIPQPSSPSASPARPLISMVVPSFNRASFLSQALDSIFNQGYPQLETFVFDACSNDGSAEVLSRYQQRLTYSVSEPDRGPAHAVNKGLARAQGEILGWLNADDLLAADALWEVARAFADDPELDMVFANTLYLNESNQLGLAEHVTPRTGFFYGEMQPTERIPAYWSYVHAVPQPTVFFRRRLLDLCGNLDESYRHIYDLELFWRFAQKAKIKKIERTQAFCRIQAAGPSNASKERQAELYRFSRRQWPPLFSFMLRNTLREFVDNYMGRKFGTCPKNLWYRGKAALVTLSALTGIGNPETWGPHPLPKILPPAVLPQEEPQQSPPDPASVPVPRPGVAGLDRSNLRYRSIFCAPTWPHQPGFSGGEVRDFHLVKRLFALSGLEFFCFHPIPADLRPDSLEPFVDALHTPETIHARQPQWIIPPAGRRTLPTRLMGSLRRRKLPVPGPRYPVHVTDQFPDLMIWSHSAIQESLKTRPPDFLFVSPQTNPVALTLKTANLSTRLILVSHDVEAMRMRHCAGNLKGISKVALTWEAARAGHFERDNLPVYDGLMVASEQDKYIYENDYGFPPERIFVLETGVDPDYFAFREPSPLADPRVLFVGNLADPANQQAAWRLVRHIMPLVRQRYPEACLQIVGRDPDPEMLALNDGHRTMVTGIVADVRPYLQQAAVACFPHLPSASAKCTVLEALSAGVPVVSSSLAVNGIDLQDNVHFLLGESDEQLAQAILRLLGDPGLARRLAEEGRKQVANRYAWNVRLSRLDEFLDTLTALPRRIHCRISCSVVTHLASQGRTQLVA